MGCGMAGIVVMQERLFSAEVAAGTLLVILGVFLGLLGCAGEMTSSLPVGGGAAAGRAGERTKDQRAETAAGEGGSRAGAETVAQPEPGGAAKSGGAEGPGSGVSLPAPGESDGGELPEPAAAVELPEASPTKTVREISFDTIKFEMKKEEPFERRMIGPTIEGMAGQKVRVRGFMRPGFQQAGIRKFILLRDNQECCFGPGAALYDCIIVDMPEGESTEYKVRPITVEGTFGIRELKNPSAGLEPGAPSHLAIYHLHADRVW